MSNASARLCAACALAFIAAAAAGPGGGPARALSAPAAPAAAGKKSKPAGVGTVQASRKPTKVETGEPLVPLPPTKPGLAHPAGWPAAPIGDDSPTTPRDAPSSATPPQEAGDQRLQNIASPSAETLPEAEEQNFFQRMIRARTRSLESEPNDPRRKELAEPPDGYRHQTQASPDAVDPEHNKSPGLFGAIGALWNGGGSPGKTEEARGAASAPKTGSDAGETGGLLGKIGGMLPALLRGSDKK